MWLKIWLHKPNRLYTGPFHQTQIWRYSDSSQQSNVAPILLYMEWNAYKYDIFSVSSNHLLRSYTSTYTSDNPGYMLIQLTSKNSENRSLHSSTKAALKEQSHSSSSAHLGSWGYITITSPHTLGHIHKNLRRWRQRNRTQSKGLRTGVCVHVCKLGTAS